MIEHNFNLVLDVSLLPYKIMHAGKLTCIYEAGNLRYIKYGEAEIIRMIYGALRNENWDTIVPEISDEKIEITETGFYISYTALYTSAAIHYAAQFAVEGKDDSTIHITMKGLAHSDFIKNRIGLCVLHPLKETKGKPVTIQEPGGGLYTSVFPERIVPHQPLKDIQQMKWNPGEGLLATLDFSGDIFETEDQRNWSDSSFKTYSTPLHIPFPAAVKKGDTMEQKVILSVTNQSNQQTIQQTAGEPAGATGNQRKIGFCLHPKKRQLSQKETEFFKPNKFSHYRAEIDLYTSGWQQQLADAVTIAEQLDNKLELVLFFKDEYGEPLKQFIQQAGYVAKYIAAILLLDRKYAVTPPVLMRQGYTMIKEAFPFIQTGYGTDAYFAALNRNRPGDLPHDFVSCSLMPQAHASDTRTIIENLESLPDIIKTIQSFTDKAIHISPVSLGKRINPDAVEEKDYFIADKDPRADSEFTKGWKMYCIQQLEQADIITFLH